VTAHFAAFEACLAPILVQTGMALSFASHFAQKNRRKPAVTQHIRGANILSGICQRPHSEEDIQGLFNGVKNEAPLMLLYSKYVTEIEWYDWSEGEEEPTRLFSTKKYHIGTIDEDIPVASQAVMITQRQYPDIQMQHAIRKELNELDAEEHKRGQKKLSRKRTKRMEFLRARLRFGMTVVHDEFLACFIPGSAEAKNMADNAPLSFAYKLKAYGGAVALVHHTLISREQNAKTVRHQDGCGNTQVVILCGFVREE